MIPLLYQADRKLEDLAGIDFTRPEFVATDATLLAAIRQTFKRYHWFTSRLLPKNSYSIKTIAALVGQLDSLDKSRRLSKAYLARLRLDRAGFAPHWFKNVTLVLRRDPFNFAAPVYYAQQLVDLANISPQAAISLAGNTQSEDNVKFAKAIGDAVYIRQLDKTQANLFVSEAIAKDLPASIINQACSRGL